MSAFATGRFSLYFYNQEEEHKTKYYLYIKIEDWRQGMYAMSIKHNGTSFMIYLVWDNFPLSQSCQPPAGYPPPPCRYLSSPGGHPLVSSPTSSSSST